MNTVTIIILAVIGIGILLFLKEAKNARYWDEDHGHYTDEEIEALGSEDGDYKSEKPKENIVGTLTDIAKNVED